MTEPRLGWEKPEDIPRRSLEDPVPIEERSWWKRFVQYAGEALGLR